MDFTRLETAIDLSLRHEVAEIQAQANGAPLIAIGIGMVEDITGFFTTGLTTQGYLKWSPKKRAERWIWPSEWGLGADLHPADPPPGELTAALWALTGTLSESGEVDEESYERIRGEYEDRVVAALARLRAEGQLRVSAEPEAPEAWVWLHYADAYDEDMDLRTFAQLNSPELTQAFARRFEGGMDGLLPR